MGAAESFGGAHPASATSARTILFDAEERMSIRKFRQWPQIWLGACLTILTVVTTSCDSVLGGDTAFASEARVLVTGESPVPMKVLVSTNFTAVPDGFGGLVATITKADTINGVAFPHDRSHQIKGRDRFLVRLMNSDTASTATIHMRVFLDGNEVFNQRATMKDSYLESISYYG